MGIRRVIDLREKSDTTEREQEVLGKLGVRYINIPFPPFSAPSPEQVQTVLSLLDQSPDVPTFLHCRRGKDRTGTVVACYRVRHDGWDNRRALDEAKKLGMSSFERGMQKFVIRYTPLQPSIPAGAVALPASAAVAPPH